MAVGTFRRLLLNAGAFGLSSSFLCAEPPERFILTKSSSLLKSSNAARKEAPELLSQSNETETIRERFKSGKVRIEKNVILTADGNFVAHGSFTEWNEKGELVQSGAFHHGKRHGTWIKIYSVRNSKLFEGFPYNLFKAPFQSTAEFQDGELNGDWSIADAHGRVVMLLTLKDGLRHGHAVWNLPSGTPAFEADYDSGVISGQFIERNASGVVVKQLDYDQGSVHTMEREAYPNKRLKAEYQVRTESAKLVAKDNFVDLILATYEPKGASIRDGEFVQYYENGAVQTRGSYSRGELDGDFEQWHANGERACVGAYRNGNQDGKWTWWHPNGMRKSSGVYQDSRLQGEMIAWDESGKRITGKASLPDYEVAEQDSPSRRR